MPTSSLRSSSLSAGAMLSSGATLTLPPDVRPWLIAPLVFAPPLCADSMSSSSSMKASSASSSGAIGELKSAMLKLTVCTTSY